MNDTRTATVRTIVPAGWAGLLVWALNRALGWNLQVDELAPFLPALMAVVGVFYRAGRLVEARWPKAGWVLFGSARTPSYNNAE